MEITLGELAKHNTKEDAWIAIDGVVYNVTSFIPEHPGGEVIMSGVGTDASKTFHEIENHKNVKISDYLQDRVVGKLKTET